MGVLTAGLSSDTPRRHSTSPLSLTAQSAMLWPRPLTPGLSGMTDTSLRAMGATSSQGPLVTSLHFLYGGKSTTLAPQHRHPSGRQPWARGRLRKEAPGHHPLEAASAGPWGGPAPVCPPKHRGACRFLGG